MSITLVQEVSNVVLGTGSNTITFSVAATSAGNLLVLVNQWNNGPATIISITDNQGNIWVQAPGTYINDRGLRCDIWYIANAIGGVTTINVNGTNPGGWSNANVFLECAGAATSSPVDVTSVIDNNSATTPMSPILTPTVPGDIFIIGAVPDSASLTGISTAGWTAYSFAASTGACGGQLISTNSSSQQATYTAGGPTAWVGTGAAFKAAGSGPNAAVRTGFFLVQE